MASSPGLPAPSVVVCEPDVAVDGEVSIHPPNLDILAQEERHDAPSGGEPMAEMGSGGGQDLPMRCGILNLPSATLQSGRDAEHDIQVGRANLRTFLTPSFKSLRFLSPIPEISPLTEEVVHAKPQGEICTNVINEIQRHPYRTTLQALEGGGFFFGKCLNDTDVSMIDAETAPNWSCMDYTMESSCLQLEGEATNMLESRLPHLESLPKVNGGVKESITKLGIVGEEGAKESVGGHNASPRFNSRKSLVPLIMEKVLRLNSPGNVSYSSTSVLNGTYNLSHCQGGIGGQGLQDVQAGNITVEAASGVGPIAKEDSSTQANTNDTLVLHSGTSLTGSNLTVDLTENGAVVPTTEAVEIIGLHRDDSKVTPELQSGEIVARPNLTIDIAEQSDPGTWLEDSRKSLGLKSGTFEIDPDPAHEPLSGPNLTVHLTPPNVTGRETGLTEERAVAQNVTIELQPGQLNESAAGVNLTFQKSKQLHSEDDPVGVCEADGAEGHLGSLTKVGNCDDDCSRVIDMEDSAGGSLWSLDSSMDSKANFLITSTPLVVPKVFNFATKPSDACERLSVVDHSEACSEGGRFCMSSDGNGSLASAHSDQPSPVTAKPPTKSLTRPTGLPLKCGVKTQPSNRKSLACPSSISNPKSLYPLSRPSSSRLSLAPPQKTLAGPQVPGTSSFLSSTLTRIGRKTGGVLRTMAAPSSLEASVGSTTSHRRHSVSEKRLPVLGLQKPRTFGQQPPSSATSLLALRPTGHTMSRLPTQKAGLGEPKGKGTPLPTSSLKQTRGSVEETLPLSKRKKVDTLPHAMNSVAPGSSAGSQPGPRRPATRLRGAQSKLPNFGGGQISVALTTTKSGPTAPLLPGVQPVQDAPPTAMGGPCENDPGLANRGAGTPATDCENCAKYRRENARLRAELEERDRRNS